VTLLPGQHEVVVRQSGYQDYVEENYGRTGNRSAWSGVTMHLAPRASVPEITSTLKLNIKPNVRPFFWNEKSLSGHGSNAFRSEISPAKHRIRVEFRVIERSTRKINCSRTRKAK